MLLICSDIIGRTFFNAPVQGVAEIVANSIVAIVFLQAGHTVMSGRMTRTDILIGSIEEHRPFAAAVMRVFFHLAGIFVFALIAWGTWPKLVDAWVENEFFGAQGVFTAPVWPIKACLFGGSILTCLAFATQVLTDAKEILNASRVEPLTVRHSVDLPPKGLPILLGFALLLVLGYGVFFADLGRIEIGVAAIFFMLMLIFSGAHIAVVLILLSFLGIWLIRDNPNVAMRSLALAADGAINRYLFGVVPLFVLMGLIVDTADIGRDAYRVAAWMLQKIRGGLGMATVAANAVFASITGISIASAAVFSRVAVPQMVANGYNNRFALGVVAGSSVLGMLIPPSLLLIIYGVLAEQSVGALFLAAIVPGILLALVFGVGIYLMARFRPRMVMQSDRPAVIEGETWGTAIVKLIPITVLVIIVLGGIYSGFLHANGSRRGRGCSLHRRCGCQRKSDLGPVLEGPGRHRSRFRLDPSPDHCRFDVFQDADPFDDPTRDHHAVLRRRARADGFHDDLPASGGRHGHDPRFHLDHADPAAAVAAHCHRAGRRPDLVRHRHRDRGGNRPADSPLRPYGLCGQGDHLGPQHDAWRYLHRHVPLRGDDDHRHVTAHLHPGAQSGV